MINIPVNTRKKNAYDVTVVTRLWRPRFRNWLLAEGEGGGSDREK